MKNLIPLTLAAALLAAGPATAQTPAYSNPVGYVTQTLLPNKFNLVGLPLHNPIVASQGVASVAGNVITYTAPAIVPVAGRTYILEILNDANPNAAITLEGSIQEVTAASITSGTITTPQNLATAGLTAGARFSLRIAPTIEEIFKTDGSVLSRGPTGGSILSDILWVPTTPGNYARYYVRTSSTGVAVCNAVGNVPSPNVPLIYQDGMLIEKKAIGPVPFVVIGSLKKTPSRTLITTGFNPLGTVFAAGSTLQNLGLEQTIGRGPTGGSFNSDIVWIPSASVGGYDRYYFRNTDSTWRNAVGNSLAAANLAVTPGIFIERKPKPLPTPASIEVLLNPPAFYSNL